MARQYDERAFKRLRQPDDAEFKQIAEDFKIDLEQQAYLIFTVTRGLQKCKDYHDRRNNRPDADAMRDCAKDMCRLLDQLEASIKQSRKTINFLGMPENLGIIGRLLSFEAVAEVVGREQIDGPLAPALALSADQAPPKLLALEWEMAERKQLVDAKQRADLLIHIVRKLREQFSQWLESEAPDSGGAPAQPFRRIMLFALACDASRILGKEGNRPAISRTGGERFVKLCNQVLGACQIGGPNDNESAIRNLLKDPGTWAAVSHWNELER